MSATGDAAQLAGGQRPHVLGSGERSQEWHGGAASLLRSAAAGEGAAGQL